jgi:hypothetical protein
MAMCFLITLSECIQTAVPWDMAWYSLLDMLDSGERSVSNFSRVTSSILHS